jgi:hypothetical protein
MGTDRVRSQVLAVLAGLVAALWLYPWLDAHRYRRLAASPAAEISVTSAADNGPGSLREALFRALRSDEPTAIVLDARELFVATPLPPLATAGAIEIRSAGAPRTINVAPTLTRPVFDIRSGRVKLDGVVIRGAQSATAVHTTSAERVTLRNVVVAASDVGVGAAGGFDLEVTGSTFDGNRIGVEALGPGTSRIDSTTFREHTEAAIWAIGAAAQPLGQGGIHATNNHIAGGRFGVVLGNTSALIADNEIADFRGDGVIAMGGTVEIVANRIWNGRGAAIRSVGARSGLVERNDVHEIGAMGILVQAAAAADVRDNRVYRNGYGIVTVLNEVPATVQLRNNLVLAQLLDGLVVFGDAPLVAENRSLRNRGAGIQIFDVVMADVRRTASPLLTNNVLEDNGVDEPVRSAYFLDGRAR